MKIVLFVSIFILVISCNNSDKSGNANHRSRDTLVLSSKDTPGMANSSKHELSDKEITIIVSYAAIECGCPQWFETKFRDVKFLEGVELFYVEPTSKALTDANSLWDGEHLPLTLKITGRFSKEREFPVTYHTKGEAEKAHIFWYNKISIVSPSPD